MSGYSGVTLLRLVRRNAFFSFFVLMISPAGSAFSQSNQGIEKAKSNVVFLNRGAFAGSAVVVGRNSDGEAIALTASHNLVPALMDRQTGKGLEQKFFRLWQDQGSKKFGIDDVVYISNDLKDPQARIAAPFFRPAVRSPELHRSSLAGSFLGSL